MGFEPLYEASLRALRLQARFPDGPHCGRGSSRAGLSPGFFPFRGPTHVLRLFLCWRPRRSRSPIPSLTPSWWSPCLLLRRALLPLSGYVLSVPSAFSHCRPSRAVSSLMVSVLCAWSLLQLRHLPMRWVPSEPRGFAVAPPIPPSTELGQSPRSGRTPHGAQVGVSYFYLRSFLHVFMAIVPSV